MQQHYFIVVLAHSLHGRLRRIHVPQRAVYGVLALAALGLFSLFGMLSSYVRMAWKVADYNSLRQEAQALRVRYDRLLATLEQTNEQLATLQLFAREVSMAYGIKRKLEGPADISGEGRLVPTFSETLSEYNFLKSAQYSMPFRRYARLWQMNVRPNLWPVVGRLEGHFGARVDPFSGAGAFHTGIDIDADYGVPVVATADGIVKRADRFGGYGKLVVIDHGNNLETYYAHLSRINVIEGQEIRRGETVGAVGRSGRVTAAHLHYEVRQRGNPVNPYNFLNGPKLAKAAIKDFPF